MSLVNMEEFVKIKICRNEAYIIVTNSPNPVYRKKTNNVQSKEKSKNADKNYQKRQAKRNSAIKDIFETNFGQGNIFITLTFDSATFDKGDIMNLDFTHGEFKKFIQRMNRRYEDFIYLATFSRQQNGAWHYHMITNLIMAENLNIVQEIWGNGNCNCKNLCSGEYYLNAKNYMCKNAEEFADDKKGKRGYLCSKNVLRPIVLRMNKIEDEALFEQAFDKILELGIKLLSETRTVRGITKQSEDIIESGKTFDVQFDKELTDKQKKQGYHEVYSETAVYITNTLCQVLDCLPPKKTAKLREKIRK
jgi:hypothetical protein